MLSTGIQAGPATAVADACRAATAAVTAWLTGLPRRAGDRLFAKNDAEASWHGWQVTVLACGLARRYRDARFDTLRGKLGAHGDRGEPDPHGTRPGDRVQAVPEAWDDHWNGRPLEGDR